MSIRERDLGVVSPAPTDMVRIVRGGRSVMGPAASLPVSAAAQSQIDALAAGQAAGQIVVKTWAILSAMTGAAGVGAQVVDDAGTHTDPVTSATVDNKGQYTWDVAEEAWEWVRADGLAMKADRSALIELDEVAARAVRGKNLFNSATATIGYYVPHNGGAPVSSATYDHSDFIRIVAGGNYHGAGAFNGMRFVTYYDADKSYVAGGVQNVNTFVPPAGAAFVVVSLWHGDLASFQLEAGTSATAYEAYAITVKGVDNTPAYATVPASSVSAEKLATGSVTTPKIAEGAVNRSKIRGLDFGKNLFNRSTATLGGFISHTTGAVSSNVNLDYSDFIEVEPGATYAFGAGGKGFRFVACYNEDKAFMSGGVDGGVDPGSTTFTVPAGVRYVRVTLFHSAWGAFQVEKAPAPTSFEPYTGMRIFDASVTTPKLAAACVTADKLADASVSPSKAAFLQLGKNLFNKATVTFGYFINPSTGALSAGATWDTSDFIAVSPSTDYHGAGINGVRFRAYYDAAKALIPDSNNSSTTDFTTPADCHFVRVSIWHSELDIFQLEAGSVATSYQAFGYTFTSDIIRSEDAAAGWSGLSWAALGDSITAGGNWQGRVVAALGLLHTNFGVGGTKISGAPGDANAMCQDTRINAIPSTVDLITLMGGTNDWAQNVVLGAEDSTDPTTFNGALNTYAAKAFARWPGKKLALAATPYGEIVDWESRSGWTSPAHNSLGLTTNAYAEAIRKAASRLNIPLIDVARFGGWGARNIETYLGGSTSDHLHPAAGSLAARGIASTFIGALRQFEPVT